MKEKLIKTAHHRNGVCGHPFTVALLRDEDGTRKVIIRLDKDADKATGFCCCCVLDVDQLTKGEIEFGLGSYRGDRYAHFVDKKSPKMNPFGPMIISKKQCLDIADESKRTSKDWQKEKVEETT